MPLKRKNEFPLLSVVNIHWSRARLLAIGKPSTRYSKVWAGTTPCNRLNGMQRGQFMRCYYVLGNALLNIPNAYTRITRTYTSGNGLAVIRPGYICYRSIMVSRELWLACLHAPYHYFTIGFECASC